jgi:hypothetical protein
MRLISAFVLTSFLIIPALAQEQDRTSRVQIDTKRTQIDPARTHIDAKRTQIDPARTHARPP